jgi:hypothetical protein
VTKTERQQALLLPRSRQIMENPQTNPPATKGEEQEMGNRETPLFRPNCRNCHFCTGLGTFENENDQKENDSVPDPPAVNAACQYSPSIGHCFLLKFSSHSAVQISIFLRPLPSSIHPCGHDIRCSDRSVQSKIYIKY